MNSSLAVKRLLITPGEPAGIGPDITLQIAQHDYPAELVVIADPDLLKTRANALQLPLSLVECDLDAPPKVHQPGELAILPIKLQQSVSAGKLDPQNAPYVLNTLKLAVDTCLQHKAHALVTGPVHKALLNQYQPFSGHTEFLGKYCHVKKTVMLFVVDKLKVALATTHLPLQKVPQAITKQMLKETIDILHQSLLSDFNLQHPKILVSGLNPHAGENGLLGSEELDIIKPIITEYQSQGMDITGPFPADTLFTPQYLQQADAIISMYHDQALPVIKYLGFDRAVNMTLGLPFIRTSVDHGTALSIAGTKTADAGSLKAAINLAIQLHAPY